MPRTGGTMTDQARKTRLSVGDKVKIIDPNDYFYGHIGYVRSRTKKGYWPSYDVPITGHPGPGQPTQYTIQLINRNVPGGMANVCQGLFRKNLEWIEEGKSWRDYWVECKECGCEFHPNEKQQINCKDCK